MNLNVLRHLYSVSRSAGTILSESDGNALIIAKSILDSQEYNHSTFSGVNLHNGGEGYGNDYKLSDIRQFLNNDFYNTAFNELQKAIIKDTTVDNSSASNYADTIYACDNTNDNIFLLSFKEVETYYNKSYKRITTGTDYAKCQGLYVSDDDTYNGYSNWTLRSPRFNDELCNYYVDYMGDINNDAVYYSYDGVRPCCNIKL